MGTLHTLRPPQNEPAQVRLHPRFKRMLPGFFVRLGTAIVISIYAIGFSHEEALGILQAADPDKFAGSSYAEVRRRMWRNVFRSRLENLEQTRDAFLARQGPDATIGK